MNKFVLIFFSLSLMLMSKEVIINLEIKNIIQNSGELYIFFYNSKENFEKKYSIASLNFPSKNNSLKTYISHEEGEYVIYIYQDINDNHQVDTNILNIPREPYAVSNHNGNGFLKDFNKLKLYITEGNRNFSFKLNKF